MGNCLSIQQHQDHDQWLVTSPLPPWSDIPPEIVGLVLCCLPAHIDRVRFGAVCTQWHHATRLAFLPMPLPFLVLRGGTMYSLPRIKPLCISGCAGYSDVCGKWLVFSNNDSNFLKDPLTNITVTLPSRIRVRHLGTHEPTNGMNSLPQMEVVRLIFGSSSLIAALVTFGVGLQIAVCQPGATSWWSVHMGKKFVGSVDTTFLQRTLYALDLCDSGLFAIDINVDNNTGDPWISRFQTVIQGTHTCSFSNGDDNLHVAIKVVEYLVESRGKVLMVCRMLTDELFTGDDAVIDWQTKFEVFEANLERSQWTKVTRIGDDQVLFLRRWCSKSVCISGYEMPGDHIVFLENDGKALFLCGNESKSCCNVYGMRDGKISTSRPMISWMNNDMPAAWLFPAD